jgi:hypothetical protein
MEEPFYSAEQCRKSCEWWRRLGITHGNILGRSVAGSFRFAHASSPITGSCEPQE